MIRDDAADLVYNTETAKFNAVIDEIEEMREEGRPVLVGTVSIETSERLSDHARRSAASRTSAQRQAARARGGHRRRTPASRAS